MAKKKFNVSSTLSKNKDTQLAPKVPLRKSEKNIEEVKDKVEQLHTPAASPKTKPAPPRKRSPRKPKSVEEPQKLVRMTIDTPELMHRRLKIKSIEMGLSIRDYVLRLIEKDLK